MKRYIFILILLIVLVINLSCTPEPSLRFKPSPGWHDEPVSVEMTAPSEAYDIYYTTDGSEPTAESTPYTEPIEINEGELMLRAIAIGEGLELTEGGEYGIGKFDLDFILENHDGKPISYNDFKDEYQYMHLVFSADWCPHCNTQAGYTNDSIENLRDSGYTIESLTILSDGESQNSDVTDQLLDLWNVNYGLEYVLRDENKRTLYKHTAEYGNYTGFPYNLVFEYNETTEEYDFLDSWSGGYPYGSNFEDAIISIINSN